MSPLYLDARCHPSTLVAPQEGLVAIYGLYDPRSGEIRYVGKTNVPKRRLYSHWRETNRNLYRMDWIRSLLDAGVKPQMAILAWVEQAEWPQAECYFIDLLTGLGCRLTNLADGGRSPSGWKMSDEGREKISRARKGKPMPHVSPERRSQMSLEMWKTRPRTASPEARQRMSESHKGVKHLPERAAKNAEARRGLKRSDEARQHMSEAQQNYWAQQGPMAEESRQRISESLKQYYQEHPEARQAMSERSRGRKTRGHTSETRAKMSAAAIERERRKKDRRHGTTYLYFGVTDASMIIPVDLVFAGNEWVCIRKK